MPTIEEEPAAVQPGELIGSAPPERRRYDGISPDAGPLVCASCGTGNKEGRHFCRRCAASLRAPEPEVEADQRLSWWARLFGRPGQKALPAGTRPLWKSRRFPARFVAFLAVFGLAGGVASANRDSISGAPPRILDEILNESKVPVDVVDSEDIDKRTAKLATDRYVDTFWTIGLRNGEHTNFLEARFDGSPRLVYVFITGLSSNPPSPEKRPSKVLISVHQNGAKEGTYQNLSVVDVPADMQRHGFYVGADNVESFRLTIVEPKHSAAKTVTVSLAEVQFTGR